jgi:hypothetical protein
MREKTIETKVNKRFKKTKGGYLLSRNGVPLDSNGNNVFKTLKFHY